MNETVGRALNQKSLHIVAKEYPPRYSYGAWVSWRCGRSSVQAILNPDQEGLERCLGCFDPELHAFREAARQSVRSPVACAIKQGRLHPQMFCEACQDCPNRYFSTGKRPMVIAHHDDYTKPLSVRWLCHHCHVAWHKAHEPVYPLFVRGVAA